jgi:sigma-B regulation protein RsbU (phosphoserine phosphatase)
LLEEAKYSAETIPLETGDILVLYTDGITEAVNSQDKDYGQERLAKLVSEASQLSARDLVREVRGDLEDHIGSRSLDDDTTLVVCKVIA